MRWRPLEERFWEKVNKDGPVPHADANLGPRWVWTAGKTSDGYGQFRHDRETVKTAHITAYELLVGPVPDGKQLDHRCRVRRCVRPDHLEPVTQRMNIMRGMGLARFNAGVTHCPKGHPYKGRNLYVNPNTGARNCRTCLDESRRRYLERKRKRTHVMDGATAEAGRLLDAYLEAAS